MDLRREVSDERIKLLRIPDRLFQDPADDLIEDALEKVASLADRQKPDRLVIEDFAPFVRMRSLARLRESCLRFLDRIAASETTTVLGLGEPANLYSEEVVAFLRGQLAGLIHIDPGEDEFARRLTLMPALGSLDSEVVHHYDIRRLAESLAEIDASLVRQTDATPVATSRPEDPERALTSEFGESAARIRFLSESEFGELWTSEVDPFSLSALRLPGLDKSHFLKGLPPGHAVDARADSTIETDSEHPPGPGPMESANVVQSTTSLPTTPTAEQRSAFAGALDEAFDQFVDHGTRFAIGSVRVVPSADRASAFHRIAIALRGLAQTPHHLLVDFQQGNAALLVEDRAIGSTSDLLAALRDRLGSGPDTDELLHGVGVILLPTGHPYLSAADFLEQEFDRPMTLDPEPAT